MTVNKVILIGNLGQKPELRSTSSGTAVTNLRVATTDRRKGGDGQWTDYTEWHTVVVYGSQAENVCKYLDKGRQVYVEGRLQTNTWNDRDGNKRRSTEIIAQGVRFLGGRQDNYSGGGRSDNYSGGGRSSGASGGGSQDNYNSNPSYEPVDDGGEIPF